MRVKGSDESVAISIFGSGHRGFGLDDGVDATNCMRGISMRLPDDDGLVSDRDGAAYRDEQLQSQSRTKDGS